MSGWYLGDRCGCLFDYVQFTCKQPRKYGGNQRCFKSLINSCQESKYQTILSHSINNTWHWKQASH
uniref:Uncharacterized protein n=1 Tax=Ciona intestinalis TaxID=7719 RepID=H2Y0Y7_CIOIN